MPKPISLLFPPKLSRKTKTPIKKSKQKKRNRPFHYLAKEKVQEEEVPSSQLQRQELTGVHGADDDVDATDETSEVVLSVQPQKEKEEDEDEEECDNAIGRYFRGSRCDSSRNGNERSGKTREIVVEVEEAAAEDELVDHDAEIEGAVKNTVAIERDDVSEISEEDAKQDTPIDSAFLQEEILEQNQAEEESVEPVNGYPEELRNVDNSAASRDPEQLATEERSEQAETEEKEVEEQEATPEPVSPTQTSRVAQAKAR